MPDQAEPGVQALHAEIARLNKIIQALMNRAERNASIQGTDFNLFHTAITLEDQVRRRTDALEAALQENEKLPVPCVKARIKFAVLLSMTP